jgi:SAM-dependent methyltransferase
MARLEASGPNAGQIEFWNGPTGDRWVDFQESQDRMLGPLGEAAMAAAEIAPGHHVIDIGCGCGTTTLGLAQRVGPSGHILGIDISTPMLERARERAASEGDLSIDLQNRDAAAYQFERQAYDRVFSRFGVMFFADPAAAFANIRAALKPGGRLAFVCWQPLDLNPWMATTIAVASRDLERPDPPGPDDPGPFAFRDPDRVKAILSDAGFSNIEISSNVLALNFEPDIESTVRKLLQLGPMAQPFAEAPEDMRAQVRKNLAAAIEDYLTDDGVKIDSASWIVSADNP